MGAPDFRLLSRRDFVVNGIVRAAAFAAVVSVCVSACGIKPAPDFRGRWRPVNELDTTPRAIPLQPVQRFFVLPVDRTLKDVVERWAKESGRRAAYRAPTNFSVHIDAAKVSASTLETAAAQLADAYRSQAILISVEPRLIIVSTGAAAPAPPSADVAN
jgi:hypothetical protein